MPAPQGEPARAAAGRRPAALGTLPVAAAGSVLNVRPLPRGFLPAERAAGAAGWPWPR